MHHKYNNNNVNIEYNMIICSASNIDITQGIIGYGADAGKTDWRITNTTSGVNGNLNIVNSITQITQASKLTILDSGNVGISNINPASLLDVSGDFNTSNYKKNNRDVISDTSNYTLSASNILAPRVLTEVGFGSNYASILNTTLNTRIDNTSNYVLSASNMLVNRVSSQWTSVATGINYTPTAAHILPFAITSSPAATTTSTIGDYTCRVFTYTTETAGSGTGQSLYTLNVPGGIVCDILMVGGGGGGGSGHGGGGGAGQLVLIKNAVLNGTYTIRVGSGGIYSISQERGGARPPTKGKNSTFDTVIAEGGGASTNISADMNGGSGAGGDGYTTDGGTGGFGVKDNNPDTFASGTVYSRGNNGASNTGFTGGGGGGAGVAGNVNVGGDGLSGINEINFDFLQNFGSSVGQYISAENKTYFAGGGGGGASSVNNISKGGGGIGGSPGGSGLASTGSGGGGGGGGGNDGGNGGSGIVIIRYLSATANVGIGTANPLSKLHVYDDATNNTILTVQNNYNTITMPLPNEIVVTGTTGAAISGTSDRYISFLYTSDSSGLTGQTQYTFATTEALSCDILIVAGGGGGGSSAGGGGGAGGLIYLSNQNISPGNYTAIVGKGGAGSVRVNGYNSSFMTNIAIGGGFGGGMSEGGPGNGGSGGGGNRSNIDNASVPGETGGSGTAGQGNSGGQGKNFSGSNTGGGGGGGAGAAGVSAFTTGRGANGGIGLAYSITGTSTYYAGGGGGGSGSDFNTAGSGGLGGGGNGSIWANTGGNASANTGGGGGGGSAYPGNGRVGGAGGSGIIIIRYRKVTTTSLELIRSGLPNELVVTSATGAVIAGTTDRYISFPYTTDNTGTGQTLYTFTTTEALMCDIFMIGGGGAGGYDRGGGGGAGGCIIAINQLLNIGTYNIKVGNGQQAISGGSSGSGRDSEIFLSSTILYRAKGGGVGGDAGGNTATSGGCGGGAASGPGYFSGGSATNLNYINGVLVNANTITASYANLGYKGGDQLTVWESVYDRLDGAGGGGIGSAGSNHGINAIDGSPGGNGIYQVVINNNTYNLRSYFTNNGTFGVQDGTTGNYYIGGGGGGGDNNTGVRGTGGLGGGGSGGENNSTNVQPGSSNTGSGGGGAAGRSYESVPYTGGNGGSGIVIIRYRRVNTNYKIGNYGGDFKIISSTPAADTDYIRITSAGSSIYNPTGSPQWSTTSDRRIKENIEKASYTKCYDTINKLELYRFNYIKELNNINKDLRQLGYIAQEVQEIFPKAVSAEQFYNDNLSVPDLLTIDITQINYSLYGAVKKLMEMYNDKRARLKKLQYLLNIESDTSNIIDISTSNIVIDSDTSNTSNTSNI